MLPLADASAASLHPFVTDHVEPGATVFTDGWQGYHGLEKLGYVHARHSQRRPGPTGRIPASYCPRCTMSPHWPSGGCWAPTKDRWSPAHLASYLNEFVFRFNRRRSRSRGMVFYRVLELAAAHEPVRYQDLIATKRPRAVSPTPPPDARAPAEPGAPSSEPPLENCRPGWVRLNGYPRLH